MFEEFEYLWNDPENSWVIVKDDDKFEIGIIINRKNSMSLLIEDEILHNKICDLMIKNGCEVLSELPELGEICIEEIDE